jgi:thiamine-monophosphate kinase
MVSAGDLGERELIRKAMNIVRPYPSPGQTDDAVLFGNDMVVCTDIVSMERHFSKGMSYEEFGWTAAAVNYSDIASMGARPLGFLAAMSVPKDISEEDFLNMISGMEECTKMCEAFIIGGDTKFGAGMIAGTAIGSLEGRSPLLRSGARPGDMVAITGSLGSAAAGYFALENDIGNVPLASLRTPTPRIKEGLALSKSGVVTSCMDLSDGLAEGVKGICGASRVGMDIHMDFIPEGEGVDLVSARTGMDKKDLMLYWGGDYELLFTFAKENITALYDNDIDFSIIGKVTNDNCSYINEGVERTVMKDGRY